MKNFKLRKRGKNNWELVIIKTGEIKKFKYYKNAIAVLKKMATEERMRKAGLENPWITAGRSIVRRINENIIKIDNSNDRFSRATIRRTEAGNFVEYT